METKTQLGIKLLELKKQVAEIETKIFNYNNFVSMTAVIKGKLTIQIHPFHQLQNLQKNGWRMTNDSDLKEFSEFIKKETLKQ